LGKIGNQFEIISRNIVRETGRIICTCEFNNY